MRLSRGAKTLSRRLAEKDGEIARLTEKHAAFERVVEMHLKALGKKMQAVEALCANARRRDRVIYPGEILDILEWE